VTINSDNLGGCERRAKLAAHDAQAMSNFTKVGGCSSLNLIIICPKTKVWVVIGHLPTLTLGPYLAK